ncbi:MAG: acetate--CoA ligase family protein [Hyphomicrobiaceae bacterium]
MTQPRATMDTSRLRPLLEPRSIAIVGASEREGSFGRTTLDQTLAGKAKVPVYPVNPRQSEMLGMRCYPSLADLPAPADLVIFAVANATLEEQIDLAIATGCKAGTIFASCYLEGDRDPPMTKRIAAKVKDASFTLCGANCMGFYNPAAGVNASWYAAGPLEPGPIGLVTHSGTLFITLAGNDPRYAYSLIVSAGQELNVTAADYVHYMLDRSETKVIALILETVRDPSGFISALERANAQDVPVVAIKVGRTAASAKLAQSHSGAITGNDAAYEALFEKYGVMRAQNVDELMATAMLMSSPKRAKKGGIAAVLDSGGARGLFLDLAHDLGVPIAQINKQTEQKLKDTLEYGLDPVNPVDAWGTGHEYERRFRECLQAVTDDPDAGLGVLITDVSNDSDAMSLDFARIAVKVDQNTDRPVILGSHWSQLMGRKTPGIIVKEGTPFVEGTENILLAAKHAFSYRDHRALPKLAPPPAPDASIIAKWKTRLAEGKDLVEAEGLALLADFGIAVPRSATVKSEAALADALAGMSMPVALKTAMPGIHHKSDVGGVKLGIKSLEEALEAYRDLAKRLGPDVLIAEMAKPGTELAVGMIQDEQFGPVVIVGAGGTMIEVLKDRRVAMPPIDAPRATALLDRLKLRPLLDVHRKRPAADMTKLADTVARFSVLAATLGDQIAELDVNPLIAGPDGAIAVDALVIPKR